MVPVDIIVARKLQRLYDNSRRRGLDFNLDFKTVKQLLSAKKCYFTKVEIDYTLEADAPNKLTIDRVDNDKGYVKGNVVACARSINARKGSLTVKEIEQLYKGVMKKCQ